MDTNAPISAIMRSCNNVVVIIAMVINGDKLINIEVVDSDLGIKMIIINTLVAVNAIYFLYE